MNKRILIIDDDMELCTLLKKYLELENYFVSVVHNGNDGLLKSNEDFHLIVLDVMLPGKNGFEILSEMRKNSTVPVLMLTAKDSEIDKVSGLRLGADDYLTKPFSINEFLARAESLIRRYTSFNGEIKKHSKALSFNGLTINPETREVTSNENPINLTAKEFDLLYFLAENSGKVFTKKQIYNRVWGSEYAFDDNNIMVHIRRLRKKIEETPENPEFIQTVWGVGYKFGGKVL